MDKQVKEIHIERLTIKSGQPISTKSSRKKQNPIKKEVVINDRDRRNRIFY
jgi:hypothetical protein